MGMWIVYCDELHSGVRKSGDKCEISRQTVQFGNDEPGLQLLAGREGLRQFRPIIVLSALDLSKFSNKRPSPPIQVVQDGFSLCLEAQPRLALPVRTDAEI